MAKVWIVSVFERKEGKKKLKDGTTMHGVIRYVEKTIKVYKYKSTATREFKKYKNEKYAYLQVNHMSIKKGESIKYVWLSIALRQHWPPIYFLVHRTRQYAKIHAADSGVPTSIKRFEFDESHAKDTRHIWKFKEIEIKGEHFNYQCEKCGMLMYRRWNVTCWDDGDGYSSYTKYDKDTLEEVSNKKKCISIKV